MEPAPAPPLLGPVRHQRGPRRGAHRLDPARGRLRRFTVQVGIAAAGPPARAGRNGDGLGTAAAGGAGHGRYAARRGRDLGPVAVDALLLVADHVPVLELDHAPAHHVDDARVVRGHHDGRAGAVDPVEQRHDPLAGGGVDVPGRLVGEQDQRPVDEGAGDGHALLLATGELVREAAVLLAEPDELEHLRDLLGDDAARAPDHLQGERHVLERRLVREEAEVLEDAAHVAPEERHPRVRQVDDLPSGDPDAAGVGQLLPEEELQEGRLPRSRRSDDEDELTLPDLDRTVAKRATIDVWYDFVTFSKRIIVSPPRPFPLATNRSFGSVRSQRAGQIGAAAHDERFVHPIKSGREGGGQAISRARATSSAASSGSP